MNYQIIYQNLIEKRKQVLVEGYKEKHHIIPKCVGGTNEKDNLVALTAREHFIAHLLLVKIYQHKSLIHSANMMSYFKRYNSREYSWLKEKHSALIKGKPRSEETKRKISEAQKGKPKSDEHRKNIKVATNNMSKETKQKMSDSRKGKPSGMKDKIQTDEHKQKISESNKGKVRSEEAKENYSKSKEGDKNPNFGKKMSDETRQKMSETAQKNSEKNSQKMKEIWALRKLNQQKEQ